jgi:hypothetical protein
MQALWVSRHLGTRINPIQPKLTILKYDLDAEIMITKSPDEALPAYVIESREQCVSANLMFLN